MFNYLIDSSNKILDLNASNNKFSGRSPHESARSLNEVCECCFKDLAVMFCQQCTKLLCLKCDKQMHDIPLNRHHQRIPASEVEHLKNFCFTHSLPIKYYCNSCEEPICDKCQILGPHNNKLHKISSVNESFQEKFNFINSQIHNVLEGKGQILVENIGYVEQNLYEIKTEKTRLENELRVDYTGKFESIR